MSGSDEPKNLDSKVVWDARNGGEGPVVKDGVFYPQRRSFLTTLGGLAALVIGVMAGKGFARTAAASFPANSPGANTFGDHQDFAGCHVHTDSPSKHVDVPSEVGHADMIREHMDSHCDSPHGDHNDHHDHADKHVDQ